MSESSAGELWPESSARRSFVLPGQTLERQGRPTSERAAYFAALQLAPLCDDARRGLARLEERIESGAEMGDAGSASAPESQDRTTRR